MKSFQSIHRFSIFIFHFLRGFKSENPSTSVLWRCDFTFSQSHLHLPFDRLKTTSFKFKHQIRFVSEIIRQSFPTNQTLNLPINCRQKYQQLKNQSNSVIATTVQSDASSRQLYSISYFNREQQFQVQYPKSPRLIRLPLNNTLL